MQEKTTNGTDRSALVNIFSSHTLSMASYGLLNPILTLYLTESGASSTLIGAVIGIWAVPITFLSPAYPTLIKRFGFRASIIGALLIAGIPIMLFPFLHSIALFIALQIVGGAGFGLFWVASESSLIKSVGKNNVGLIMVLWGVVPAGGAFIGSCLPHFIGPSGVAPFLISSGIMLTAALISFLLDIDYKKLTTPETPNNWLAFILDAPGLLTIAFFSGIFESIPWGMLVLYGLKAGLSDDSAITLISIFFLGNFTLSWLLGIGIDQLTPKISIALFSAISLIFSVMIPLSISHLIILYVVVFLWAPVVSTLQSNALVLLAERMTGSDLVVENSTFVMFTNAGMIVGPPLCGFLMDYYGASSMPALLAFLAVAIGCVSYKLLRDQRSRPRVRQAP